MTVSGTAIAWPLRAWLAVEVMFGVAAVSAIGISPGNTKTNFAWPITPVVMAAMERWFAYVLRYSRRDQLSSVVALKETGLTPIALSLDNPSTSSFVYSLSDLTL